MLKRGKKLCRILKENTFYSEFNIYHTISIIKKRVILTSLFSVNFGESFVMLNVTKKVLAPRLIVVFSNTSENEQKI